MRSKANLRFRRGEEVGAFMVGSTVIVLFPNETVEIDDRIAAGTPIKVGEPITVVNER